MIRTGRADERTVQIDLSDLNAFLTVARAKGFREGAWVSGAGASRLSEAKPSLRRRPADFGRHPLQV
jgi:hypothetical protein